MIGSPDDMVPVLEATRAGGRLGLSTEECLEVLEEAGEQIEELRSTLGE